MGSPVTSSAAALPSPGEPLRAAFVGSEAWIEGCSPPARAGALATLRVAAGPGEEDRALEALARFRPHVSVAFDPSALAPELLEALPGTTLGILVGASEGASPALAKLDRVASFAPPLSGARVAGRRCGGRSRPRSAISSTLPCVRCTARRERCRSAARPSTASGC